MYAVPENEFGIFASSIPLSQEDFRKLCDGPIAACQPALLEELDKVLILNEEG